MRRHMRLFGWLLLGLLVVAHTRATQAQQFHLTVASAIAGNTPGFKDSLFVVRTNGCPEAASARITAHGEGIVNGERRTTAIEPAPLSQAGAYAIGRQWMTPPGTWVVNLTATCGQMTAGAIVPIGREGFLRDPSKFFPRPATVTEINEALKSLASAGGTR